MTNIIIAITIFTTYTLIVCGIGRKVPNSLSKSVFMMPPYASWIWTVCIGTIAFLIMPTLLDKAGENWKFLAFLSCVCLFFVALCPLSPRKDGPEYMAHMVGSYICTIASQFLVAFTQPEVMALWLPWCIAFLCLKRGKKWPQAVFFAEITCFVTTFTLFFI